jgi:hypothetical protein
MFRSQGRPVDGIHWTKYAQNPVLRNNLPGSWTTVASAPFVLLRDSTFHMWYAGEYGGAVGYAASPRVLTGMAEYGDAPASRDFHLQQNYPNPFNPTTIINFQLPIDNYVTLKVFDALGREVRTLVNEEMKAGSYTTTFDATGLASGVYYYRLQSGSFIEAKKLLLLR